MLESEIGERRLADFWKSPGTQLHCEQTAFGEKQSYSGFYRVGRTVERGRSGNPRPFCFISLHFASLMKGGEYELSVFSHRYWESRA